MNGAKKSLPEEKLKCILYLFTVVVHAMSNAYNLVEERHVNIQLQLSVMCAQRATQQ